MVSLEHARTASRRIGTAIGIPVNLHKITSDQAFDLLRVSSQQGHRELHQQAEKLCPAGAIPLGRTSERPT